MWRPGRKKVSILDRPHWWEYKPGTCNIEMSDSYDSVFEGELMLESKYAKKPDLHINHMLIRTHDSWNIVIFVLSNHIQDNKYGNSSYFSTNQHETSEICK